MSRLVLVVAALLLVGGVAIAPARAQTCSTASPLYSAVAGDASAKSEWLLAGVAGPIPNGYSGTVYVSVFNPSTASATVHADVFEYQEISAATDTVNIFSEGADLAGGRSTTFAFNGLPPHPGDMIAVPAGKVHFDIKATGPVNVYAEQWMGC